MKSVLATILIATTLPGIAWAQSGNIQACQSYAANASGMGNLAVKQNPACLDYSKGVHGDFRMHYDWCLRTPAATVAGAEANIRRLITACTRNATSRPPTTGTAPARSDTTRWAGPWNWVRPMALFGKPPSPQDYRTHASIELLQNNRIKLCISKNPCSIHPFSISNGRYNININSGFITIWTNDQGRSLEGQYWWDRNKRSQITPDATFVLKR